MVTLKYSVQPLFISYLFSKLVELDLSLAQLTPSMFVNNLSASRIFSMLLYCKIHKCIRMNFGYFFIITCKTLNILKILSSFVVINLFEAFTHNNNYFFHPEVLFPWLQNYMWLFFRTKYNFSVIDICQYLLLKRINDSYFLQPICIIHMGTMIVCQ